MIRACLLVLAAFACAAGAAAAPAAAPVKPLRVLFIGNSLTDAEVPKRVAQIAEATGRRLASESLVTPAFSLEDHWSEGAAQKAIARGWDVVVLQQGPSAQAESRAQLEASARKFAPVIRAAGAKPALYMVWPPASRPREFREVIAAYRSAALAADAVLLPVGEAWLRALSRDSSLRLYDDAVHPSRLGRDLAALTIYFALFPAGPQEFDEAFVARIAKVLDLPAVSRDLIFDAATLAIDRPLTIQ